MFNFIDKFIKGDYWGDTKLRKRDKEFLAAIKAAKKGTKFGAEHDTVLVSCSDGVVRLHAPYTGARVTAIQAGMNPAWIQSVVTRKRVYTTSHSMTVILRDDSMLDDDGNEWFAA